MKPAIRVENLSKSYRLGSRASGSYRTLRETITDSVADAWHNLRRRGGFSVNGVADGTAKNDPFWALKDVSFEVQPGEVVGIIGRNGAGKSTLLKILSRITEPNAGRCEIRGRVASLLEVGTGFHPELTGRENIYLNGSLLGMTRKEITRKYDEIVAFSDIERFLDTPVKRYSSGMYVRLAFAVAAHLDPEILIVDEVLAVGDGQFQQKCLGKLQQVALGGRTVLFVSHQMGAISRLCNRAILMEKGRLVEAGRKDEIINLYLKQKVAKAAPEEWVELSTAEGQRSKEARFVGVKYRAGDEVAGGMPYPDGPLEVDVAIESDKCRRIASMAVAIYDRFDTRLVNADTIIQGRTIELKAGRNEFTFIIASVHLKPGQYTIGLWLATNPIVYDHLQRALQLEIEDIGKVHFGRIPDGDGKVTCSFDVIESA